MRTRSLMVPTWDEASQWYLSMVNDPTLGFNQLASDQAVELLGETAGKIVLDVGCGEGHIARRLARAGAHVIGAEPAETLRQAAMDQENTDPLGVRYIADSAEGLSSVASGSVDAVASVLV